MDTRKHVDISELYDLFQERKDCYFVCCDIKHMISINEISTKAGDQAIIETLNRMYAVSGREDMVFRIGGDEFALLTDSSDKSNAARIAETLSKRNGEPFCFEGKPIPLNLYVKIAQLESTKKYSDLFIGLHNVIRESKV